MTVEAPTGVTPASTSTTSPATATPTAADPAVAADPTTYRFRSDGYFFSTPSGKFTCGIDLRAPASPTAGCQGSTTPVPPRPASCPEGPGWGHGLRVDASGETSFLCAGGVVYGSGFRSPEPVLAYGHSLTAGGFVCAVRITGVTCTHLASGHGFMIAAETNRRF